MNESSILERFVKNLQESENGPGANAIAEIIPAAIVMDFIYPDFVGKKRDDESDRHYESLPQAMPETSDLAI